MTKRVFTVDEANALVPALEEVFGKIDLLKQEVRDLARKIEVLHVLWDDAVDADSNPDYHDYIRHKRAINKAVSEIEQLVQEEILRRGIRFPAGGIENGLVDFPTTYQGRWVYLCWRCGESELRYWHETDTGFPGRRQITRLERERMGSDNPEAIDDSTLDF